MSEADNTLADAKVELERHRQMQHRVQLGQAPDPVAVGLAGLDSAVTDCQEGKDASAVLQRLHSEARAPAAAAQHGAAGPAQPGGADSAPEGAGDGDGDSAGGAAEEPPD
eukprot:12205-Pyramimonas_sp.AAC.1